MAKTYKTIVAIIFDEDEFLILKKKGRWVGWQFVQGKQKKDEEIEETVKREVMEETGLDNIEIAEELPFESDYWFMEDKEKIHKLLAFFLVRGNKNQDIRLSREHSDYEWCSYEEALDKIRYNKEIFKKAYDELQKIRKKEDR